MKIQIGGFDIEINNDGESMSIKIMDASGKELSNNTYSQTLEGNSDTEEVQEPAEQTPEQIAEEPEMETEETEESPEGADLDAELDATAEEDTETSESFLPDFETFKTTLK